MSSSKVIYLRDINSKDIPPESIAIFGGTFDPFHQGHLTVIEALCEFFSHIVVAPTSRNPWKAPATAGFNLRLQMIEMILEYEGYPLVSNPEHNGIFIDSFRYCYVGDYLAKFRSLFSAPLFWAVGEDDADSVQNWKNYDSLSLTILVAPVLLKFHAKDIRCRKAQLHPAIQDFVAQNELYGDSE